ncbi:double-strand break repair helicase AddA [Roseibium litorale]|uniref:DNA 3'-5' helicase n=1 Tax=Roseibium litorale TaxID=2803841 RepID=A0ABR9CLN5_9HYPH|nr:double-strand break repair helicase AddA [Roseibium litorale]MBD8891765.1 double-strand break repair helicase AddA [Roseibium litorale]
MSGFQIPELTREKQDRASQPRASAWVSANAGSGKTFVLSRRVVRLLLDGTDPSRILCLTFTKAAAAEMATRVFRILGDWVTLDDARLADELTAIDGRKPDAKRIALARRLFARALETPGGLKIQTIHAFCEALLHQFPLEANVAGHFTVLDDRIAGELMAEARGSVLQEAEAAPESLFGQSLAALISLMPDSSAEGALDELIGSRDSFRRWIDDEGDLETALAHLARDLGADPDVSLDQLDARFRSESLIDENTAKAYAEAYRTGSANDQKAADRLLMPWRLGDVAAFREAWLSVFLTAKLEPRASLATKKVAEAFPQMMERMGEERDRLLGLLEERKAVVTMTGTAALLRLAGAVISRYEAAKAAKGFLDFEDLVVRTANLLSRSDAAQWVQYKLDQGLDHILVDEAQDTSPRQWQVVRALAEEFFTGEGARGQVRTIFAVGDEKQSIYSFQGAVPAYFDEMRRAFAKRSEESERLFHSVDLQLSFRSTPDVLGAVDKVFALQDAHKGLSQELKAPVHEAIRKDPGVVEIWPLEQVSEVQEPEDWTEPLDRVGSGSPMLKVARRIAETIAGWMRDGTADPGEVMVLVRKRGPFVEALNRELKSLNVPAAGSDRLVLTDHIAVKDLAALGRFLLLPEDDLSLAAVLKSPLIGLDDEDLTALARDAADKPRAGTLWQSLVKKAEFKPQWLEARRLLELWRSRADFMPPYEFYARLLSADGGRQRFRGRLGVEVDDVLDEFLALTMAYEQAGTPGLEGFLAWMAAAPTEIKRELTNSKGMVRIMTVHGSKGLEAKVVILVDPGSAPVSSRHDPSFLPRLRHGNPLLPPALVWRPVKSEAQAWHSETIDALRETQAEEYRRLLYVALTRAEDRLVVCGWEPKSGARDDCWYNLVSRALLPDAAELRDASGEISGWRWQKPGSITQDNDQPNGHGSHGGERPEQAAEPAPSWLFERAPQPVRKARLQPSRAFEAMEDKEGTEQPAGASRLEARRQPAAWPLERGRLVHRLLEVLPDIPAGRRDEAAARLVDQSLSDEFLRFRDKLLLEISVVLDEPAFAPLFSGDARAEVPVVGTLTAADGTEVSISGQIDRLAVSADEVLIVDYKTNLYPPDAADSVPLEYLAQLSVYRRLLQDIYPGRTVNAALLWTSEPSLMRIPGEVLDQTLAGLRRDGTPA